MLAAAERRRKLDRRGAGVSQSQVSIRVRFLASTLKSQGPADEDECAPIRWWLTHCIDALSFKTKRKREAGTELPTLKFPSAVRPQRARDEEGLSRCSRAPRPIPD